MSKFEFTCIHCGGKMKTDVTTGKLRCVDCGTALGEQPGQVTEPTRQHAFRDMPLTHRGEIDIRAKTAFETAMQHFGKGDTDGALEALRRALDVQADFTDAHLWIAKLVPDKDEKLDHLSEILARDATHTDALRMMMVLTGRMSQEEADRTYHHNSPELVEVDGEVNTETEALLCPVCKGNLTIEEETGRVMCSMCGFVGDRAQAKTPAPDSLAMAMLERKAQPTRWKIGSRLIHCNECGAERTISARKLSQECPFCGSNHVIVKDALESFMQPNGIVPFSYDKEAAFTDIETQLNSLLNRFRNVFDNNRMKKAIINGFYLPFWVYDVVIDVTRTTHYKNSASARRINRAVQPATTERFTDMVNNVFIAGVTSPPMSMTSQLGSYNLSAMQPYEPKLLARYAAELYSIDFDDAALEARSVASRLMKEKHNISTPLDDVEVTIFPAVKNMSFQLVLLPVWVATLIEEDNDTRPALVNGQNGTVVLGKAEKQRKK